MSNAGLELGNSQPCGRDHRNRLMKASCGLISGGTYRFEERHEGANLRGEARLSHIFPTGRVRISASGQRDVPLQALTLRWSVPKHRVLRCRDRATGSLTKSGRCYRVRQESSLPNGFCAPAEPTHSRSGPSRKTATGLSSSYFALRRAMERAPPTSNISDRPRRTAGCLGSCSGWRAAVLPLVHQANPGGHLAESVPIIKGDR